MRKINEWVESNYAIERKLRPNYGERAIGGADFSYLLKALVGEAYLRALRHNKTPDEALASAIEEGNYCVNNWNNKTCKTRVSINGHYELQVWDQAGKSEAEAVHLRYLRLLKV